MLSVFLSVLSVLRFNGFSGIFTRTGAVRIRTVLKNAVLAVYGATPAFQQPLHVDRPNIGNREAFLKFAGDIFDRCWLTNNGPMVQSFERRVADSDQPYRP